MQRSIRRLSVVLACVAGLVAAIAPTAGARPRSWTAPVIDVETTCGDGEAFSGFVLPIGARATKGVVSMTAGLTGICGDPQGDFVVIDGTFTAPVEVTDASCANFMMSTTDVVVSGVTIDLSTVTMLVSAPPEVLRSKFCSIARAVDSGKATRIATALNSLFVVLRDK